MELLILYYFFSTLFCYGIDCSVETKPKFGGFVVALFIGWILFPILLGKIIKDIHLRD